MNSSQQQLFRSAAGALAAGQPQRAVTLCQELLTTLPNHLDCQHLMGVALIETGATEQGSQLLQRLHQSNPNDPEILFNHASALLNRQLAAQALELFDRLLALAPWHVAGHNNRGSALLALGNIDAARLSYAEAVRLQPRHASSWFNLGNLEVEADRLEDAVSAYSQAIEAAPGHAQAHLALGHLKLNLGLFRQAVAPLQRCTELEPQESEGWRLLAQALAGVNKFDNALSAAHRATELAPESADGWNGLGAQLTALGRLDDSEIALRKALQLDPDMRVAWANLAALMELANRPQDCRDIVSKALLRWPAEPGLLLTQARLQRGANQLAEALETLQQIDLASAGPQHQREAQFLFGQTLDRLGDYSQAFDHYLKANRLAAQQWQQGDPTPDTIVPAMDGLEACFTDGFVRRWQAKPLAGPMPAFVVSFQRSGTTLLDTMLGSHSDVLVMEEIPVINALIREIGSYPQALGGASVGQLARWREVYWEQVHQQAGYRLKAHQRLIDKSPLHTIHLGLIQRLFPGAPIIFALRHPLDVVLSCFMQDFTLSSFMRRYTTIEGVAEVYQKVMGLWLHYQSVLPLNVFQIRYETLVIEPEPRMRELLEFLQLPWDPAVLDHTRHAKDRGLINTPSYHQVTQPLYSSSSFRWKHYRSELQPVMTSLAPWCETFGYPLD